MSGFVETQMDDADRAGVDYSLAAVNPEPVATEPPEDDLLDMDLAHDLGDGGLGSGDWLQPHIRHREQGGGWYSGNDLNPSQEERKEAAEMEDMRRERE